MEQYQIILSLNLALQISQKEDNTILCYFMRSQLVCFKCMAKFAELMCFSIVSSVHIKSFIRSYCWKWNTRICIWIKMVITEYMYLACACRAYLSGYWQWRYMCWLHKLIKPFSIQSHNVMILAHKSFLPIEYWIDCPWQQAVGC